MAQRFITLRYEVLEGWHMEEWRKLLIITLMFTILFASYSIVRTEAWHKLHGDHGYDLGVFSESLESTLTGKGFFFNTKEWQDLGAWSHFGTHNSPILFLLLIPYALAPSIYTLLVVQALAITLAAIPLFKLAEKVLNDERKALMVSLAYLLNPFTHGLVRYEFHPAVLGVPFMFLFAYFMEKGELKKAAIASILVLSVKEDAGLFLITYALFMVLRKHGFKIQDWWREKTAFSFAALGAAWIAVSVFVVIPSFNVHHSYPYFQLYQTSSKYLIIALAKLFIAFLSVAFVPIRPKYSIPVIALWLENALALRLSQAVIGFQYDYMMLSMLFIVLVYALKETEQKANLLIASSALTTLLFSPMLAVAEIGVPIVVYDRCSELCWNL